MEINYTFYFFAFLKKMIKKLLTFCYWCNQCAFHDLYVHVHGRGNRNGSCGFAVFWSKWRLYLYIDCLNHDGHCTCNNETCFIVIKHTRVSYAGCTDVYVYFHGRSDRGCRIFYAVFYFKSAWRFQNTADFSCVLQPAQHRARSAVCSCVENRCGRSSICNRFIRDNCSNLMYHLCVCQSK